MRYHVPSDCRHQNHAFNIGIILSGKKNKKKNKNKKKKTKKKNKVLFMMRVIF